MRIKKLLVSLAFLFLVFFIAGYLLVKNERYQLFGEIVSRVETDRQFVALTFDDGPTPERTKEILKILDSEDVLATFFLNGNDLKKHEDAGKLLINSGHEIGNHSYSHKRMVFMSLGEVASEIEDTEKIIRSYGYKETLRFRPPFGKKLLILPWYLYKHDIETIMWDVEPETWTEPRNSIEDRISRGVNLTRSGSIILMHVMHGDDKSIKAVAPIIRGLKNRGFQFLTVSELIAVRENRN